jgi:hypothetical protein
MSSPDYYRIIHASYRTLVQRAAAGTQGGDEIADASATARFRSCLFCGGLHGLERSLERDDECARCASPLFPAERHRLEYSG